MSGDALFGVRSCAETYAGACADERAAAAVPLRAEPTRAESMRAESMRVESMRAESMRVESVRVEPVRGEAGSVEQVSGAVSEWVEQVGRFLGVLQVAIEESSPRADASAEVRALAGHLPALIRECRAQVPTPEMIRTWVESVSGVGAGAMRGARG